MSTVGKVKVIVYDYSKEPPEALSFDSDQLTNYFNTIPKKKRIELAIQEPNFEPITIGHYLKLADNINPQPTGEFDEHGIKMLHPVTGNKVDMEIGSDHRNGQRYNVDHRFKNYMMIGYFKTGVGQDVIEMKTDGPHHSGCTDLDQSGGKCCWTEPDLDIADGQFRISSEYPHPVNHDSAVAPSAKKIGSLKERWIGYAVCAWQDGEFRHIQEWCDPDPFDAQGKPKNGWILGLDEIDKGQVTTSTLAKRIVPPSDGSVLESEIRMNNATNHDTEMKVGWTRVYELKPIN